MRARYRAIVAIAMLVLAGLTGGSSARANGVAVPTHVTVRVIAAGGKFLGDDVGGAQITIRDVASGEILATGLTHGGSGPDAIMTRPIRRTQSIPTENGANTAARYDVTLQLDRPHLVEVSAVGPLVAANPARVSETLWLYPGSRERDLLLQIPGLLVQVITPPIHYIVHKRDVSKPFEIRANVTMMCGCPIGTALWPARDFNVVAHIRHGERNVDVPLHFESAAASGAPSQFVSRSWIPGDRGVFNIDVVASQKSSGNLGVGESSVIFFGD